MATRQVCNPCDTKTNEISVQLKSDVAANILMN